MKCLSRLALEFAYEAECADSSHLVERSLPSKSVSFIRQCFHTKSAHNMQRMCERCFRSFKTKAISEEHFLWCARGHLQIEQRPETHKFSYKTSQRTKPTQRYLCKTFKNMYRAKHIIQPPLPLTRCGRRTNHDNEGLHSSNLGSENSIHDFYRCLGITI